MSTVAAAKFYIIQEKYFWKTIVYTKLNINEIILLVLE